MFTIRNAKDTDFDNLVDSYYNLIRDCYPSIQRTDNHMAYYKNVIDWFEDETNSILIVEDKNGEYVGYTLLIVDDVGGVVDKYIKVECLYIVPDYRNSKATYRIMHHIYDLADNLNLDILCNANQDITPLLSKRFGFETVFTQLLTTRSSE